MNRTGWSILICFLIGLLNGCATVPRDPTAAAAFKATHDPFEPMNRKIFAGNLVLDRSIIRPVAKGYQKVLPATIRDALRRILNNLGEPIVVGNCLLQGRLKDAGISSGRFVINSTLGLLGIADLAEKWKLPKQNGDFGQTLWAWKIPEGPYLVLPLFGPSSPRDGIGLGVDAYFDPIRYVTRGRRYENPFNNGRMIADGIDLRARNIDSLDEIQREAIDYYASLRSLYRQNRAAELNAGGPASTLPSADFYDDPGR